MDFKLMPKQLIYQLKIGAFKPDTIPMQRLSEYMSDLAKLLGEPNSVHFVELEEGSTVLNARVESEAIPKISDRLASINHGETPDDLRKAFDTLDKRLASDNATGSLKAYFGTEQAGAVVLEFPGCERPQPIDYGVIKERGTLDGIPVSITGRDMSKHAQLVDGRTVHTGIDMSEELAIKIMDEQCVYRKVIRLHGMGKWHRSEEGEWKLNGFKADHFEILESTPLRETLLQLRSIPDSGWSDIEDPLGYINKLRGDPEPDERLH